MSSERVQGRVEVPAVITCTSPLFLWLETFQFCCFSSFQEDRVRVAFFEGTSGYYSKSVSSFRFLRVC